MKTIGALMTKNLVLSSWILLLFKLNLTFTVKESNSIVTIIYNLLWWIINDLKKFTKSVQCIVPQKLYCQKWGNDEDIGRDQQLLYAYQIKGW